MEAGDNLGEGRVGIVTERRGGGVESVEEEERRAFLGYVVLVEVGGAIFLVG